MPKVDDRAIAENVWTVCCARCAALIDPDQNAVIGHCPSCGHTFSQMRLLTRQEIRDFLKNRLRSTIKIDGREHLRDVNGIEDLRGAYKERVQEAIAAMRVLQAERLARRRRSRVQERPHVIPRVTRVLRRMEKTLHAIQSRGGHRKRVF